MANKYAFLVGINEYADPSITDLGGCVNDVSDMGDTLVACGFPYENIVIRTDSRATREAILSGLQWLVSDTMEGDTLVFYYSGHGSQVPTWNDEGEVDGKDEILCPHDMSFEDEIYVRDNDVRDIIQGLPEGRSLELILDSCHSGTMSRVVIERNIGLMDSKEDLQIMTGVSNKKDLQLMTSISNRRTRYIPPPLDYNFYIRHGPRLATQRFMKNTQKVKQLRQAADKDKQYVREVVVVEELNHVLWAACRDDQTSEEALIGGTQRGAFTYHFCREVRASNGQITRRRLDGILSSNLNSEGFAQIPQLESQDPEFDKNEFGL
jgi:metacaspase-1